MKNIFLLLSIVCLPHTRSFAQEPVNLNEYVFKAGDVLEYEVNKMGKTYSLIITLTGKTFIDSKITDAITFDWEIKNDTTMKGAVSISKEARVDASIYKTEFINGPIILKNKSCLWLSLGGLYSLISEDGATMDAGDGNKSVYTIIPGLGDNYNFLFKGKPGYISAFQAKTTSSACQFSFCPTQNSNALILTIDMGWTMRLKEVR